MARLLPFRALRYVNSSGQLDHGTRLAAAGAQVTEAQRRRRSEWAPQHSLHLNVAADPHERLRSWLAEGFLERDEKPALYVLCVEVEGLPPSLLLLGLLEPDPTILPLEEGDEPPDRAAVGPVGAVTADDHQLLHRLLLEATSCATPVISTRFEERDLKLFRLEAGPLTERLQAGLADAPVRTLSPLSPGRPALVAVLPLSDRGLSLQPIHRALRNVATFERNRFLLIVREYARVLDLEARLDTPAGLVEAREQLATLSSAMHAVLLVLPEGEGKILRFRQPLDLAHVKAAPRSPTLRSLDLALLNALVLKTVLGINAPEQVGHSQVFTVATLEALVEGVNAEQFQVGFGLNAPPVWELRAVIEAAQRLPPRTLRLAPLPPEGLLFLSPEQ